MKKSRYTEGQIIGFLRQAEAGIPIKEACRTGGFSDVTFYKWRAKFGGMEASEAQRLRELEAENANLKKLLAEGIRMKDAKTKAGEAASYYLVGWSPILRQVFEEVLAIQRIRPANPS